jgi:hypothetical protein
MSFIVEFVGPVLVPVVMLVVLRVLAGRGPDPDLSTFGTLEVGE